MAQYDCAGIPEFQWTPYYEVHLLHSMAGIRFLGINKHFEIHGIIERFYDAIGPGSGITWQDIIRKLKSYYNLDFEDRVFTDFFPQEDFILDESFIPGHSSKKSQMSTDNSVVEDKSKIETLSSGNAESKSKHGKVMKKPAGIKKITPAIRISLTKKVKKKKIRRENSNSSK